MTGRVTYSRPVVRQVLAVVAGAAVASLGAVILGEYPFSGALVLGAGVLFGLFVAEAVIGIGRHTGRARAVIAAALTVAGLVWAAWIAENHDLSRVAAEGWVAVALGGVAAAVRARKPRAEGGSRPEPAPGP